MLNLMNICHKSNYLFIYFLIIRAHINPKYLMEMMPYSLNNKQILDKVIMINNRRGY